MAEHVVSLETWVRRAQFELFRTYQRPHFATTVRLDVTHLIARRKPTGVSVYRASLFAIGAGLHKAPAMLMRFRGDVVVRHDTILMSMTVPNDKGSFNFAYVPFQDDFAAFDPLCRDRIAAAARGSDFAANTGQRDDVSYLSCLPWLDYTSLNNALPGADDCIPRVSWGKIVQDHDGRWRMAMTVEVHHALVDGADVGEYFAAVQETLDTL